MVPIARHLGSLDVELIEMDAKIGTDFSNPELNTRRAGLSRLWVLGAYELVRTVEEMFKPSSGAEDPVIHVRARALKIEFERLRIPLAKFETARRFPNDSPIAYPAFNNKTGAIAWQVADGVFIERRDLADKLLDFLENCGEIPGPVDGVRA